MLRPQFRSVALAGIRFFLILAPDIGLIKSCTALFPRLGADCCLPAFAVAEVIWYSRAWHLLSSCAQAPGDPHAFVQGTGQLWLPAPRLRM